MKFKLILLTPVATIILGTATMAQVPNYLPTNGLVGWWPFNGNANDESGNGNNGIVNGATLSADRNGINAKAYLFDGNTNHIEIQPSTSLNNFNNAITISAWIYCLGQSGNASYGNQDLQGIFGPATYLINDGGFLFRLADPNFDNINNRTINYGNGLPNVSISSSSIVLTNNWENIICSYDGNILKIYRNGVQTDSQIVGGGLTSSLNTAGRYYTIGQCIDWLSPTTNFQSFNGKLDDIGIWNRALTQQEITDLYNAVNCFDNTAITPQTNSITTGTTANFTATTSDPNPSYVWQSDLGQGFQTLNNFGNYSGANTSTLSIANVQLPNHTQPIRVITTSGNCIDTSNVAVINILDTCITNVTIYDTLLTTVTDTLIINATITGINPPNNLNTLKVFPNPANTHITIDYGNFNAMSGYTLKIVNSVGQTVFTTPINQQSSYIDLSTWTGNGIYFIQLIDPQNNTIENRKIVIQ